MKGLHCRSHGRTGCEAIVHEDDDLIRKIWKWPVIAVETLAALELTLFDLGNVVDGLISQIQQLDDIIDFETVEDAQCPSDSSLFFP